MTTTSRRDFLKIATAGAAGAAFAPQASSRDFHIDQAGPEA